MFSTINNIKDYENPQREYDQEIALLEKEDEVYKIVLWNDDVNTFDDVIEALVEICKHTLEQAEQCTMLVHYKGKYVSILYFSQFIDDKYSLF